MEEDIELLIESRSSIQDDIDAMANQKQKASVELRTIGQEIETLKERKARFDQLARASEENQQHLEEEVVDLAKISEKLKAEKAKLQKEVTAAEAILRKAERVNTLTPRNCRSS